MWWSDANIEDGKSGRGKDLTKEDRRWQLQKVSNEILSNTLLGSIIFLFKCTEKYSFVLKCYSVSFWWYDQLILFTGKKSLNDWQIIIFKKTHTLLREGMKGRRIDV